MSKKKKNSSKQLKVISLDDSRERAEQSALPLEATEVKDGTPVNLNEAAVSDQEQESNKKTASLWLKKLRGLQEPSTRINKLFLELQNNTEEMGVLFAFVSARLENSLCRTLYLDFLRILSGARPVSYEVREKLYLHARNRNHPLLRVLALQSQPERTHVAPHPSLIANFASMDPELHEISLGRKKALARNADIDMVQRLSRDPDPRVIRILLDHPKLTEKDLIKVASRRPAAPSALTEVIHHIRWGARPAAQEAIALNPYSPAGLAAALLPMLPAHIRRQLLSGLNAHPLVRAVAEALAGDSTALDQLLNL